MREDWRRAVEVWLKAKAFALMGDVVDRVPSIAKKRLEQPDMPRCLSRAKDTMVDFYWPDVRMELLWEMAVALDGERPEVAVEARPGVDCLRAFLRYRLYPYDRLLWSKVRDPVWVLFTLLSVVPICGMCSWMYMVRFIIIDKSDAHQLCSFVLKFKGMQFFAHGIVRVLIGFLLFLNCATVEGDASHHHCDSHGPGVDYYNAAVGGYLLQVALVWTAFLLLRCSADKSRRALKGAVRLDDGLDPTAMHGGYLRYLLIYDLFCFVLSASLVIAVVVSRHYKYDDWTVRQTVFAAQVIYGFSSFPFFFFTIPFFQAALTHTKPTAYDKEGRCRPLCTPPEKRAQQRAAVTGLVRPVEADALLENIRALILDGPPPDGRSPRRQVRA